MKQQKGFIQIPILITVIASFLVLSGGGYFSYAQFKNYQNQQAEKEKQAQENKRLEEEEQQKLQKLLEAQESELEKQKEEIQKIKDKPSVIINNPNKSEELSRADIITQWTPNIAYIVCVFTIDDQKTSRYLFSNGVDTEPMALFGSGLLLSITTERGSGQIAIISNRHVLNAHNGFSSPSSCEIVLPGSHKYSIDGGDIYFISGGLESEIKFIGGKPYVIPPVDAGYLLIKNPDVYTRDLAKKPKICETLPRIGEDAIILGYPSIGSITGITATEGIVSGIEGDYFVTSAKVEHGNSGGAAISKDKNCYFGIPTFARTGSVESLARILSFQEVFK